MLAALDVPDALRALVHTPAGLDIGARTPADIAISILAEIVATRTAHAPTAAASHRDRPDLRHGGRRQPDDAATRRRLFLLRGLPRPLRRDYWLNV